MVWCGVFQWVWLVVFGFVVFGVAVWVAVWVTVGLLLEVLFSFLLLFLVSVLLLFLFRCGCCCGGVFFVVVSRVGFSLFLCGSAVVCLLRSLLVCCRECFSSCLFSARLVWVCLLRVTIRGLQCGLCGAYFACDGICSVTGGGVCFVVVFLCWVLSSL